MERRFKQPRLPSHARATVGRSDELLCRTHETSNIETEDLWLKLPNMELQPDPQRGSGIYSQRNSITAWREGGKMKVDQED